MSPHFRFDLSVPGACSHIFLVILHGYELLHFGPFEYSGESLSVICTSHLIVLSVYPGLILLS